MYAGCRCGVPGTSSVEALRFVPLRKFRSGGDPPGKGKQNLYTVLGLAETATNKEIKTAYYDLSKQYHPDTSKVEKSAAAVKFQDISAAYEVLGNDEQRGMYDREFGFGKFRKKGVHNNHRDQRFTNRSSFVERHYPDGFPGQMDPDYRHFVEFQRKWRKRQQTGKQSHAPPSHFGEDRNFESFYRRPISGDTYDDPRAKEQREQAEARYRVEAERINRYREAMPDINSIKQRQVDLHNMRQKERLGTSIIFALGTTIFFLLVFGGR